jgi:DGQHR domain-containing protein
MRLHVAKTLRTATKPATKSARRSTSQKRKAGAKADLIKVAALAGSQGKFTIYQFLLAGDKITQVADISRVARGKRGKLEGFQRKQIQSHVKSIEDYLNRGVNRGGVLFPNAILLALSEDVKFQAVRGPRKAHSESWSTMGYLDLPLLQQRSLALAKSKNKALPVPIVAFVSNDLNIHKEQFILVNRARPLPQRLINELLPETHSDLLPRELLAKQVPAKLCEMLSQDPNSPFFGLIRRPSDPEKSEAVVVDSAIVHMIQHSLDTPTGALAAYRQVEGRATEVREMYEALKRYWTSVRTVFRDDWGLPPGKSRLMHSAGIAALGMLMDRVLIKHPDSARQGAAITRDLQAIAPHCRWRAGTWEGIGRDWNEIETTSKGIKQLAAELVQLHKAYAK